MKKEGFFKRMARRLLTKSLLNKLEPLYYGDSRVNREKHVSRLAVIFDKSWEMAEIGARTTFTMPRNIFSKVLHEYVKQNKRQGHAE